MPLARRLADLGLDALQTALRLVPWPTEPGLRPIGQPGPESPVVLTGNYDLSVRRVARALHGHDAWLVVAPSSGINVWCAAAGGHLGTHQIVTALKTSGIEQVVRHRRAILPQLAATGVVARDVSKRCGWKLRFGPVYAADLPAFLASHEHKDESMRRVRFGARERLEMATAWAVPASLLIGGGAAWLHPAFAGPLVAGIVGLSLVVYFLYDHLRGPRALMLAGGAAAVSLGAVAFAGGGGAALSTAGLASVALSALLTFDYDGSTPIAGGSHFAERRWRVVLDLARCRGVFSCFEVCPEACFEKRSDPRQVVVSHGERCIRCGACVVQCPQDALHFEDEAGRRIEPDVIRRFKLNLLGERGVDVGA